MVFMFCLIRVGPGHANFTILLIPMVSRAYGVHVLSYSSGSRPRKFHNFVDPHGVPILWCACFVLFGWVLATQISQVFCSQWCPEFRIFIFFDVKGVPIHVFEKNIVPKDVRNVWFSMFSCRLKAKMTFRSQLFGDISEPLRARP